MTHTDTKEFISNISISYGKNGTAIQITTNNDYATLYVYSHDTIFDSIDNAPKDIATSIKKELNK